MTLLKEAVTGIIAVIILAFSYSFGSLFTSDFYSQIFLTSLILFAIILIINVISKKLMAYYVESKTEMKIWSFQRYGIYERSYFKKPVPIGIILPFLLSILSLGLIPWFAVTQSDITPTKARVAKRHDFYSYVEMTEWHNACIPAAGILGCLILSIISYFVNQPELARLSIYFACFNLIPLGQLDGTKIFFGSWKLYFLLLIISLIALIIAFI